MTPSVSAVTVIERHGSTATLTPGQPSTNTLYPGLYSHPSLGGDPCPCAALPPATPSAPYTPANPVMRSVSNAMNRKHQFVQKNEYKRDTCTVCGKRIKFGKVK